jgi:hypothetical protein
MLDLGQNALNGTLPAILSAVGNRSVGLSLYDNQFSGTVPPSYASLSWLAIAYNPLLVGALPAGVTSSKLFAWSANLNGFYSWLSAYAAAGTPTYGFPPSQASVGYGTGFLYGTSIGLDRPLVSILLDIKAAVDPSGSVLSAWNASQLQPCRPWVSQTTLPVQSSSSPVYGRSWAYVSAAGAEYCQDWQAGLFYVYTSPTVFATNTAPVGGIAALWLSGLALNGTLPAQLQELRTASAISLSRNLLSGTLPSEWCACVRVWAVRQRVHASVRVAACAHALHVAFSSAGAKL